MGRQTKLLREIIDLFQSLQIDPVFLHPENKKIEKQINFLFKTSKNKRDLSRKILTEVVLSNDEICVLLRICFKKESEF